MIRQLLKIYLRVMACLWHSMNISADVYTVESKGDDTQCSLAMIGGCEVGYIEMVCYVITHSGRRRRG